MLKSVKIGEDALPLQVLESTMIKEIDYSCIKELYDKGHSKKSIARLLGMDVKTVRRHLQKLDWSPYCRRTAGKKGLLAEEQAWPVVRMLEVDYNASILFRELKAKGYKGSYETVKLFVQPHRPAKSKGCVRYETAPGHQTQLLSLSNRFADRIT